MADRDVNLVIKAKEQATKAIDSVTDALRVLSDVQKDVGQSASKTDGLLGSLKNELAALDKEARGLAALNTVAAQMDKAAVAVGKLDAAAKASYAEYDKLSAAAARAATNTRLHAAAADAAKSAYDKQKAAVASLTAEQRKDEKATAAARTERDRLKVASQQAATALKEAERAEGALTKQLTATSAAAERQGVALAEANSELNEIAVMANKASAALGGVEATQEAVAAASARAAADMDRLNKAMAQQTPTTGTGATVASTKASLKAWRDAEAEVKRLAIAMKSTEAPSREMQTSMLVAQAAARSAKTAYTEQRLELSRLSSARRVDTTATQQATQVQAQNTTVVRSNAQAHGQAVTQTYRLRDAFKGIYGESRQAMNMFQRMRAEVLSLASAYIGLYAAINGIGTVISTMKAIEQAQNRLSVAFQGDQSAVGAEMRWLEGEAARLKLSFADLAAEYGKFAFAAKTAGFATEEMRTVFLGVAEGARVMGLSMDEVQGILKALDQIMSKGKVQAEELRGQLGDRLSGSFQLFAQAIGVSTQELDKMMEKGEVFATRSNMVAFGQKLRDVFGPQLAGALEATTAEISDFQANLQNAAHQVGEGGMWDGLGKALADLNAWFKSDDGAKFFTDIGVALGKLMGVIPLVVQNLDKLIFLFQAFAGLKLAQVFLSLTGGVRGLSVVTAKARADVLGLAVSLQMMSTVTPGAAGALRGLASIVTGLRGALIAGAAAARAFWIALGGLPGLIITGLTMIISTLAGKWLTGVDRATEAIQRHDEMIAKVREGYVDAAGEVTAWAKAIEDVTFAELRASGDEAADTMERMKKIALEQYFDELTVSLDMFSRTERDILRPSIDKFREGTISAEEFRKQIDDIAKANPNLDQKLVKALIATAQEAVGAERRLREVAAAIRAKGGAATEADRKLLGLVDAMDAVNASADTSAIDAYTAAMKKLGEAVPDLKLQLDFDAQKKVIEDEYMRALENAGTGTAESFAKMEEASRRYQAALAALAQQQVGGSAVSRVADRIIGAESGGSRNPATARNPLSTATGVGQFIESTWIEQFKKHFPDRAKGMTDAAMLALRTDAQLNRQMTELYLQENARSLADAGKAVTDTNLYLAHFLGAGGANKVLSASRDTPISQLYTSRREQEAIRKNPVLQGNATAGSVIDWAANKMGVSDREIQAQQQVVDLLAEARKRQDDFNNSIVAGVTQREFEIAQLERTEKEQLVQVELRKAQLDAQKNSLTLTDEQEASIRRSVEAQYDALTADKGRQAILEANTALLRAQGIEETRAEAVANELKARNLDLTTEEGRELAHVVGLTWDLVNAEKERNKTREQLDTTASNLDAQRQLLMDQIEFLQGQGDNAAAEALRIKLVELDAAYRNALLAKRAFWVGEQAAGGDRAAQATSEIANIDRAILQLDALKTKAIVTGKEINESIASGLAGAIDNFAKAVAQGENAWQSFGDAFRQFAADFLRQIAQMIIQALILKAISAAFGMDMSAGNGGVGGAIANVINGGMSAVSGNRGSSLAEGNNQTMTEYMADWKKKFPTRHTGGMIGSGGNGSSGGRSLWSGLFSTALRYHTGGIIGLKANERPIIGEVGEEVLDAGDPRHRDNLGSGSPMNFKAVNVFDASDMLKYALADERGQRVLMNFVRDNPRAFNSALST